MSSVCLLLLLLLLPAIAAQTYHWGPCPGPKVQPNFEIQKYLGRWYEIAKLPSSYQKGKCIEANYAVRKDLTIQVINKRFYKDKMRSVEGTAVVQDIHDMSKLGVSFSYFSPYSPYWVLTTDYDSLSVVYSCTDVLRLFHVEFAWILGRARFMPAVTKRYATELLTSEGVDLGPMTFTDQTGCKDD